LLQLINYYYAILCICGGILLCVCNRYNKTLYMNIQCVDYFTLIKLLFYLITLFNNHILSIGGLIKSIFFLLSVLHHIAHFAHLCIHAKANSLSNVLIIRRVTNYLNAI